MSSKGEYSQRDSEWNYSDIPHLNYIHSRVEGITLEASKTHISNIFLQKVGPLEIPASVNISHLTADKHEYVMTILNIAISVVTRHQTDQDGCLTTTSYEFFYRDIVGFIVCMLARVSTKRNYRILMSEDMPMRIQRGLLRRKGIIFDLDRQDLIGFTNTLDINENHVDCGSAFRKGEEFRFELSGRCGYIDTANDLLRAEWNENTLRILPKICPHEGAPLFGKSTALSDTHQSCEGSICAWHGRKIGAIARMNFLDEHKLHFCIYHTRFTLKIVEQIQNKRSELAFLISLRIEGPEIRGEPL
jgi:hypothetical protein